MTVFFEGPPRIVVQGATGREARMVVRPTNSLERTVLPVMRSAIH